MRQASIYAVLEMAEIILITLYSIGGIKLLASTKSGMTGALLSTTSEPAYFLAFYYAALTVNLYLFYRHNAFAAPRSSVGLTFAMFLVCGMTLACYIIC